MFCGAKKISDAVEHYLQESGTARAAELRICSARRSRRRQNAKWMGHLSSKLCLQNEANFSKEFWTLKPQAKRLQNSARRFAPSIRRGAD